MSYKKPTLVVCKTCRYSVEEEEKDGKRGGEILLEIVREKAKDLPDELDFDIRGINCFMACGLNCNAMVRCDGKHEYLFGKMTPDEEGAETLLDYFAKYCVSETGQVPFKQWPQGVKGHFVMRAPRFEDTE